MGELSLIARGPVWAAKWIITVHRQVPAAGTRGKYCSVAVVFRELLRLVMAETFSHPSRDAPCLIGVHLRLIVITYNYNTHARQKPILIKLTFYPA